LIGKALSFLTEAGEKLYGIFGPQFASIESSVDSLKADKARASGLIASVSSLSGVLSISQIRFEFSLRLIQWQIFN